MNEFNEQPIEEEKKGKKGVFIFLLLLAFVLLISIGYAILSSTINITGSSTIADIDWNIHFANIQVTSGSVPIGTGDSAATINPSTLADVSYTVTLDKPGDFYEFTVDVVNSGSIDGMVESVVSKMNNVEISALPNYLEYSVTYSDGKTIASSHLLAAGTTETYRVRVGYRKSLDESDLPGTDDHLSFQFSVNYVQANEFAVDRNSARYVYRNNGTSVDAGASISGLGTIYGTYQQVVSNVGKNYFLRHKIEGTEVVESSVGFVRGGNVYYLIGGGEYDSGTDTFTSDHFSDNLAVLAEAFDVANECTVDADYYECEAGGIYAFAASDGGVSAGSDVDNLCDISPEDASYCFES